MCVWLVLLGRGPVGTIIAVSYALHVRWAPCGTVLQWNKWTWNNYGCCCCCFLAGWLAGWLAAGRTLSVTAPAAQSAMVFTGVFIVIWVGAAIVTINAQLLGSSMYVAFQCIVWLEETHGKLMAKGVTDWGG